MVREGKENWDMKGDDVWSEVAVMMGKGRREDLGQ